MPGRFKKKPVCVIVSTETLDGVRSLADRWEEDVSVVARHAVRLGLAACDETVMEPLHVRMEGVIDSHVGHPGKNGDGLSPRLYFYAPKKMVEAIDGLAARKPGWRRSAVVRGLVAEGMRVMRMLA